MKNTVIYVLTFVLALGLGFGGAFLIKGNAPSPEPMKHTTNTPKTVETAKADVAGEEEHAVADALADSDSDSVKPASSGSLELDITGRIVENGSGTKFKVSGFSVIGAHSGTIEYLLFDSKGNPVSGVDGVFEVPSNATYYVVAEDKARGLTSEEQSFRLSSKLTKARLESVINDRDNDVPSSVTSLCVSNYKVSCSGYSAKTLSDLNGLYLDHNELADKKAEVSNIKYNENGKVQSFAVVFK